MIRALIRYARLLPRALERLHLEWALKEISPLHPDVGFIVRRINELESQS